MYVSCFEGVCRVTSLCPTSPTQLGTNFYLELEFDSGADLVGLSNGVFIYIGRFRYTPVGH